MKEKKWSLWQIILILIGVLVLARQTGSVLRLLRSGDRLEQAQSELGWVESENEQLKKRLSEVDSPEFVEKEAREKLGLAMEGETVYILPEITQDSRTKVAVVDNSPNWKKWWDLYVRL